MSDEKKYLWHLSNERWEAAMETIEDDGPPKTFKQVHQRYLDKLGHKNGGKSVKKCGRISKRQKEEGK